MLSCSEMLGMLAFRWLNLKICLAKKIVHGGTLLKNASAVGFLEKPSFWESVSFHHEMFCVTNFGLVLCICIVNATIFIKKKTHIDKPVQDQFFTNC